MRKIEMIAFIGIITAGLALAATTREGPMTADMLGRFTFDWCKPGSTEGTQIFKAMKIVGCKGSEKKLIFIADATLQALCAVQEHDCTSMHDEDVTQVQRDEYTALLAHAAVKADSYHRCISESADGTILFERHVPSQSSALGCDPKYTARSYNWVMNKGCVWLGSELVGCVDMPSGVTREQIVALASK